MHKHTHTHTKHSQILLLLERDMKVCLSVRLFLHNICVHYIPYLNMSSWIIETDNRQIVFFSENIRKSNGFILLLQFTSKNQWPKYVLFFSRTGSTVHAVTALHSGSSNNIIVDRPNWLLFLEHFLWFWLKILSTIGFAKYYTVYTLTTTMMMMYSSCVDDCRTSFVCL